MYESIAIAMARWDDRWSGPLICEREKLTSLTSAEACKHQGRALPSGLNATSLPIKTSHLKT